MRKTGLDSFPINVVNNDNVDKLIKEYGYEGHAFLIAICQKIFAGEGYYIQWDERVCTDFVLFTLHRNAKVINKVSDIVSFCLRRGIFSSAQFEEHGILTSKDIQEFYIHATKKRKQIFLKKEYLLVKVTHLSEKYIILDEKGDSEEQSKVKVNNNYLCMAQTQSGSDRDNVQAIDESMKHPTLQQIEQYVAQKCSKVNPKEFFAYYDAKNWRTARGNPIRDWKAQIDIWSARNTTSGTPVKRVSQPIRSKNQFQQFSQRTVTVEQMNALEQRILAQQTAGGDDDEEKS